MASDLPTASTPPAGPISSTLDRAVLLGVGVATLALYLALPEHIFQFDGVLFATILRESLLTGEAPQPFAKHFLFLPTFHALGTVLQAVGIPVADHTYRMVQVAAGACAALLNVGLAIYARWLGASRLLAVALAALLAVSRVHWGRGLEGQTYTFGQFFALLALGAAPWVITRATPRALMALGSLSALAVLFHVSHVAGALALAGAITWAGGQGAVRRGAVYLLTAGVLSALGPVVYFRLDDPANLQRQFLTSTNSTTFHDSSFFQPPTWELLRDRVLKVLLNTVVAVDRAEGVAALAWAALVLVGWAVLVVLAVPGLQQRWRTHCAWVTPAACSIPCYVGLYAVATPGFVHNQEPVLVAILLLVAAGLAAGSHRVVPGLLLGLALLTGTFNLVHEIGPISRPTFNRTAQVARDVGAVMPPDGLYLSTGGAFGEENLLKAYLGYFGHRLGVGLDMVLASFPAAERVDKTRAVIRGMVARHGGVHTSSLTFAPDKAAQFSHQFELPEGSLPRLFDGLSCFTVGPVGDFRLVVVMPPDAPALVERLASFHAQAGREALAQRMRQGAEWTPCGALAQHGMR